MQVRIEHQTLTPALEYLAGRLKDLEAASTVIVCIGNDLKGDDAAGPLLYEALRGRVAAQLINAATVPENYIQTIIRKAPRAVIVVDAADFNAPPGEIAVLDPADIKGPTTSTHILCPATFINMIRAEIAIDTLFIAIQPKSTQLAQPPGPQVAAAIQSLAAVILTALGVNIPPGD